jgi:hypothetical protein
MPRLLLILLIIFPAATLADLEIDNAWIKNLPPTVLVRAGYMNIFNPGSKAVSIVSVTSDAFKNIEVHQTIVQDGLVRMEQVQDLTIEPNSQLNLQPGGIHLMMMHPTEITSPGDKIQVTIELSDGSQQSLIFTVKK